MLDIGTFGKSKAAEILADKLSALGPKYTAKVGALLSRYNFILGELTKIDSKVALGLLTAIHQNTIDRCETYPDTIKTYLKNVVSAKYKITFKELDGSKPYKNRKDYPAKPRKYFN